MLEYSAGQQRVFEIFDEIIDAQPDDSNVGMKALITKDVNLRARIRRAFEPTETCSRTDVALSMYGFIPSKTEVRHGISEEEVHSCYSVDNEWRISFDEDRISGLSSLLGCDTEVLKNKVRESRKDFELELISKYVEQTCPTKMAHHKIPKPLLTYIRNVYGNFQEFYTYYAINKRMFSGYSRGFLRQMIDAGRDFERIVESCFESVGEVVIPQGVFLDCRPDFVLGDSWVDAKLSKSTVFTGAKTIQKYSRHTDSLIIIYAINDLPDVSTPQTPESVQIIHVLDYFKDINSDLVEEINEFIARVDHLKSENKRSYFREAL